MVCLPSMLQKPIIHMAFQVGKRSEVIEQNTSTAAGFKAALGGSDCGEFRAKGRASNCINNALLNSLSRVCRWMMTEGKEGREIPTHGGVDK